MPTKKQKEAWADRRRKHHHWVVAIFYPDGEKFERKYTIKTKADGFAERQRRSPAVKSVKVRKVS